MVFARTTASAPPGTPQAGLRERKKIQTRQAIRRAAFRLFEQQGYDATPVDRIAAAADVSPSTVFRYFPTKEDIVLTDDYDAVLEAGIRARPAGEPMVESVRHVAVEALHRITAADRTELAQRARLIRDVPAIRGRTAENHAREAEIIGAALAERTGRPADDLEVRVISAAILAALQEAMLRWVAEGPSPTLEELIHRTLDVLARGLTL
ncbi:TetR/AcrR family transcriptional regulator [Streptomyces sp. YGL11-2]|uniref:TetR/AcrR family transcriptional regulator n=1 Tax=Streptomyces sp. YGL11-2 TaxID=3414028 RepID=UPI003CE820A9